MDKNTGCYSGDMEMKYFSTSQASKTMAHLRNKSSRLETFVIPKVEEVSKIICRHQSYCIAKNLGNINCLTGQKQCASFGFYNKYGENYNSLGIGI